MNRWFDDWKIERTTLGNLTIELPNSNADVKKLVLTPADLQYEVSWLVSFLETALMELTKEVKDV